MIDASHASARWSSSPRASPDEAADSTRTWSPSPLAASSVKARENRKSPAALAAARPALAQTVGAPRRSGAASSTSSWTSVAAWTSSTATPARTSASCAPSRGSPRGQQDEQGAQALAPGGDRVAGPAGQRRAGEQRDRPQPVLDPPDQSGQVLAARLDDRGDVCHATSPTCSAMMPPAVRIQRTFVRPAPSMTAASPSGAGKRFTELGR